MGVIKSWPMNFLLICTIELSPGAAVNRKGSHETQQKDRPPVSPTSSSGREQMFVGEEKNERGKDDISPEIISQPPTIHSSESEPGVLLDKRTQCLTQMTIRG